MKRRRTVEKARWSRSLDGRDVSCCCLLLHSLSLRMPCLKGLMYILLKTVIVRYSITLLSVMFQTNAVHETPYQVIP